MPLTFFKPTSSNKGCLLSVSFNSKEQSVWLKFVRQTKWDDAKKRGSFKGGKFTNIKLSLTEVGGILNVIRRDSGELKLYHDSPKNVTQIFFNVHFKKVKEGDIWKDSNIRDGFAIRVNQNNKENSEDKNSIGMGLNYSEAELLYQQLTYALTHIFNSIYATDKAAFKASQESKESKTSESEKLVKKEVESEENEDDIWAEGDN